VEADPGLVRDVHQNAWAVTEIELKDGRTCGVTTIRCYCERTKNSSSMRLLRIQKQPLKERRKLALVMIEEIQGESELKPKPFKLAYKTLFFLLSIQFIEL
jgi:hypothetical protein